MVKKKDCAYELIGLESKPKQWRKVATKEMIKQGNDISMLKKEMGAVIGICITILTVLVGKIAELL